MDLDKVLRMSLSPRALRERVAQKLTTSLGARGWHESRYIYHMFPATQDGHDRLHLSFAVGILGDTSPLPAERNRTAKGIQGHTTIAIKWAHLIRADGQLQDYDAALDREVDLVGAVYGTGRDPDMILHWGGVSLHSMSADGTHFIGETRFVASHGYPLEP